MYPPSSNPAQCLFLDNQFHQYKMCQVEVPDVDLPLAAIEIEGEFYSFFRLIKDSDYVLAIVSQLTHSGDRIAILKKRNGYSLWVVEEQAKLRSSVQFDRSKASAGSSTSDLSAADLLAADSNNKRSPNPAPSKILNLSDPCYPAYIRVPDLDQPVKAIAHNNCYYSLFRMEKDAEKIISIVMKTARRGDETLVVKTLDGYAVCVIEPDASPL